MKKLISVVALTAACLVFANAAEARGGGRGFFGGRSFSRPSPMRTFKPAPAPRPVQKTTVIKKNTTIINQAPAAGASAAPSSGGGFWSTVFGSAVGSMAGNAVYDAVTEDKDKQPVTVQVVQPSEANQK